MRERAGTVVGVGMGPLEKVLPDGRLAEIQSLTLGRARINVGDGYFVDDGY
jgi:hypothetical protein